MTPGGETLALKGKPCKLREFRVISSERRKYGKFSQVPVTLSGINNDQKLTILKEMMSLSQRKIAKNISVYSCAYFWMVISWCSGFVNNCDRGVTFNVVIFRLIVQKLTILIYWSHYLNCCGYWAMSVQRIFPWPLLPSEWHD